MVSVLLFRYFIILYLFIAVIMRKYHTRQGCGMSAGSSATKMLFQLFCSEGFRNLEYSETIH